MPLATLTPVFSETFDAIMARLIADANPGLTPEDPAYIDTTEGHFWDDFERSVALEIDRLYQFAAVEVPAVMFIQTAYGSYLDDFGEMLGVPRKGEAQATGAVTFSGPDGTVVSTGTQVGVPSASADADEVAFETTAGGVISGATPTLTLPVRATEPGSDGNVAAGAISLMLTPIAGVTVANADPTGGGADPEPDQAYAERLMLEQSAPAGSGNVYDYQRWALAYVGVGHVSVEPEWDGPGTVRVVVTDDNNDPVTQQVADGLQIALDPPRATATLDGAQSLSGGTLTVNEATTDFHTSGKLHIAGQSIGYTGKTANSFTGCSGGSGTAASGATVTQGGSARGKAPVGADVTVATPQRLNVDVAATVAHETGYSLDGAGGTVATRDVIADAVGEYVNGLDPGDDVLLNRVEAAILSVIGVYDVSGATLNGVAANLAVAGNRVPSLDDLTLA